MRRKFSAPNIRSLFSCRGSQRVGCFKALRASGIARVLGKRVCGTQLNPDTANRAAGAWVSQMDQIGHITSDTAVGSEVVAAQGGLKLATWQGLWFRNLNIHFGELAEDFSTYLSESAKDLKTLVVSKEAGGFFLDYIYPPHAFDTRPR
jgi:hypothetical protein